MKSTKHAIRAIRVTNFTARMILLFACVVVVIFVVLHIIVNLHGKALVIKKLEQTFNRKISIADLHTSFPAYIHLKGVEVEGLFKIDEVVAGGGLFDVFSRHFRLSYFKLVHPVINLDMGEFMQMDKPAALSSGETKPATASPEAKPREVAKPILKLPNIYVRNFIVINGFVDFVDRKVDPEGGYRIKIENLNARVHNLNLGLGPRLTSFNISGKMPWSKASDAGTINLDGWINFPKQAMEATLKIEGIDGIYLRPYYSQYVDLEKARIEKARLNFTSNINGVAGIATVQCHLELTDIVRTPRPPEETEKNAERIADAVLGIFKAMNEGKIVLDFSFKTRMDSPEFGLGVIKAAVEDKFAQVRRENALRPESAVAVPAKIIESTTKGVLNITKAVVVGTVSIGVEMVKAAGGLFKSKKPAPAPNPTPVK